MALINSFNYGELAVPKDFAVHCTPLGCLFSSGLYLTTNLPAHASQGLCNSWTRHGLRVPRISFWLINVDRLKSYHMAIIWQLCQKEAKFIPFHTCSMLEGWSTLWPRKVDLLRDVSVQSNGLALAVSGSWGGASSDPAQSLSWIRRFLPCFRTRFPNISSCYKLLRTRRDLDCHGGGRSRCFVRGWEAKVDLECQFKLQGKTENSRRAWDPYEIHMRSIWDPYEIHMRSIWDPYEIHMRSIWDPYEMYKYVYEQHEQCVLHNFHMLNVTQSTKAVSQAEQ